MKRSIVTVVCMAFCAAGLAGAAVAQEAAGEAKKKEPVVNSQVKEVQGEVSSISKRSISIVVERDLEKGEETELLLPYDKTLKLEHKRSLAEIQTGDIVSVKYLDETIDYGDRKTNTITAKIVTFMNPASQDSPYRKARESAQQEPAQQESLSLKGVKSDE